jgi:uncharacterized membrane protein
MGSVIGLLLYPCARRVEAETMPARQWLIIAAVPMMIDFTGHAAGIFTNTFWSRAATGMMAGAAAAFYILPGLVAVKWRASSMRLGIKEQSSPLAARNP